jgi:hypothetical protein
MVAICQRSRFVVFPAAPDRTDGVDDNARWQTISTSHFGLAWTTTAQRAAFGEQFGACSTVNRAIDTATAEKRCVRRVHNGVNLQFSDVAAEDFNSAGGILHEAWDYNDEVRMTNDE